MGENQFQTEKHGKQDAIKTTKFDSLPDVLIFHLKRFYFKDNAQQKILDRFEYPETLQMAEFMTGNQS